MVNGKGIKGFLLFFLILAVGAFSHPAPGIGQLSDPAPAKKSKVSIDITPSSHDFGKVTVGEIASQTFRVRNTGDDDIEIKSITLTGSSEFSLGQDLCSGDELDDGDSCTFIIIFSPLDNGKKEVEVSIPFHDEDDARRVFVETVKVRGEGFLSQPAVRITDSVKPDDDLLVPFGTLSLGDTKEQTVTVTSDGNADLLIGGVGVADPLAPPFTLVADGCSGAVLPPGKKCTIRLAFSPLAGGSFNDSFDIPTNDPDNNRVTITVSGTGRSEPLPAISVTDSVPPENDLRIPFGTLALGDRKEETVTVANSGSATLEIGSAGPLFPPFARAADGCSGRSLAPGQTCTIQVAFSPSEAGVFESSFDVLSNDPDRNPVVIAVSGVGSAFPVPGISVVPTEISFGEIIVGEEASRTVRIGNTGSADLSIGAIGANDALGGPFSIVEDNCSKRSLSPGATCTFLVGFRSATVGSFQETFDILSNDPAQGSLTIRVMAQSVITHSNRAPTAPLLLSPADGEYDLGLTVTLRWTRSVDPDGDSLLYRVSYSTDPEFFENTQLLIVPETEARAGALLGFGLLALLLSALRTGRCHSLFAFLLLSILLFSCASDVEQDPSVLSVKISQLPPTTTYYWKVEADDGRGGTAESEVRRFNTTR
jgi:hypothetical protein